MALSLNRSIIYMDELLSCFTVCNMLRLEHLHKLKKSKHFIVIIVPSAKCRGLDLSS